MMSPTQCFLIGAKVIGLYFLIWGIISVESLLVTFFAAPRIPGAMFGFGTLSLPLVLVPLILIVVAIYLIRQPGILRLANIETEDGVESAFDIREIFGTAVKLFGVYLIIANFESFVSVLSNYLWVVADSNNGTRAQVAEAFGQRTNVLPALTAMLFGILLVRRGDLLASGAYSEADDGDASGS
jgi:hypothetical protein